MTIRDTIRDDEDAIGAVAAAIRVAYFEADHSDAVPVRELALAAIKALKELGPKPGRSRNEYMRDYMRDRRRKKKLAVVANQ